MCLAGYEDFNIAFTRTRMPIARKEHICCECNRTINPGEKYQIVTQKTDGQIDTFKTCQHCLVPKQWIIDNCNGYMFEGIKEDIEEHIKSLRWEGKTKESTKVARLFIGMRRQWKSYRDDTKLMAIPKME